MELTYEEAELMFRALKDYIRDENDHGGEEPPALTALCKKLGEYLHG